MLTFLQVHGVSYTVPFDFPQGSFVVVAGPRRSGKSTFCERYLQEHIGDRQSRYLYGIQESYSPDVLATCTVISGRQTWEHFERQLRGRRPEILVLDEVERLLTVTTGHAGLIRDLRVRFSECTVLFTVNTPGWQGQLSPGVSHMADIIVRCSPGHEPRVTKDRFGLQQDYAVPRELGPTLWERLLAED